MKIRSPLPHRKARIEIIPLIDIMFFLLASFMLVSLTMSKLPSIPVNLPTATQARREFKPDLVALAVDRTGDVWLEKQRLTLEELHRALLARLAANTNLPVYISGDKDTPHGRMVFVLDFVRRAGVQKVAFAVVPAEPVAK